MELSVVIALYNERESLRELVEGITAVAGKMGIEYEIIMVNDGSTDGSWGLIKEMAQTDKHIRGISFRRNYGKSPALHCGFAATRGDVVITMDADLQDDPNEIPALYDMIAKEGYDLVSGWKKKRYGVTLTSHSTACPPCWEPIAHVSAISYKKQAIQVIKTTSTATASMPSCNW